MAKKDKKSKAVAVQIQVPQTREDVASAILRIGNLQREHVRVETAMNDELANIKATYEAQAEPMKSEIIALTEGVNIWCAANRDALTSSGKVKFHAFTTGEVRWRITPPKVMIKGVEMVLTAIKAAGLTQFIRIKEEINKEAILQDDSVRHTISGISIQQTEEFVVVPFETKLEEIA